MIYAFPAGIAPGIVDSVNSFFLSNGLIGADIKACAATLTEGLDEADLRFSGQAFRICAPVA